MLATISGDSGLYVVSCFMEVAISALKWYWPIISLHLVKCVSALERVGSHYDFSPEKI